jgi:hypothetical protein
MRLILNNFSLNKIKPPVEKKQIFVILGRYPVKFGQISGIFGKFAVPNVFELGKLKFHCVPIGTF